MMLEASELVLLFKPVNNSVLIGHVPLMENPARTTASRKVSQPVLDVPVSRCVIA
jgi:hypothetical protein